MYAYFTGLSNYLSESWNRFWFEATDSRDLSRLRVALGIVLLAWQLSFTSDLIRWFGPNGWMDGRLYHRLVTSQSPGSGDHISYLFAESPTILWVCHFTGTLILALFTIGFKTRWMNILSMGVVLAYVHRAPFVAGETEMLLSMMTIYLAIGSAGDYFSWDARRRATAVSPSSYTTIARRLIQLHLVLFYLIVVCTQLAAVSWWRGDAIWWIAARQDSRLIDFSWIRTNPNLMNLWTHAIIVSELLFLACIWNVWLRPIVIVTSSLAWLSLGLASGNLGLVAAVCVAHLVFWPFGRDSLSTSQGKTSV